MLPKLRSMIKTFRQRLSRNPVVQWFCGWMLASYVRFVYWSSRRIHEIPDSTRPYQSGDKSAVYAFWHGRLMMILPHKPAHRPMHVLISQHNDGEIIAKTAEHFDIATVRGSTSRGGSQAAREVLRLARRGDNISITPDGPRGPNRVAQAGIIQIARMCGKPIIPVTYSSSRHKAFNSWDRMQIPLPFGRFVFCAGEPFHVPRDADDTVIEELRKQLEDELNALTHRADMLCGVSESRSQISASRNEDK